MNTFRHRGALALALILFMPAAHAAAQTLLVDTGQPTGSFGPLLCASTCGAGSTFQNLAGQFTLSSANSISSAQLWVQAPSTGGQLAVVIRADSAGLPGASISSQTYTVPNQTTSGWVTFTFTTQPVLDANTPYWLSFEPVVGSAISYNVTEGAPNPLPLYSLYNSLNSGPFTEALGLGMRISGTPAAAPTLLIDTGTPQSASTWDLFNNTTHFEFNAGQFVLDQAATIRTINGYMSVAIPGSINVKIYAGNKPFYNNIVPGTSIFSQTYTLNAGNPGWVSFPLAPPYPTLAAGTYWISFEPVLGSFFGFENFNVPNPLPNYAYLEDGNTTWVNSALNVGIQVLGTQLPPATYGTAGRAIMTGSAFGITATSQDSIEGGDGQVFAFPYDFLTPPGWAEAWGKVIPNGLEAGAYTSTSGPCGTGNTCGIGAGRGVAYRTWTNTSNVPLTFQVNASLDGEFQESGGTAAAGVYVFDAATFTNTINASGLATPQFLLNGSTLTALSTGGSSLAALFPPSGVLLNDFQPVTGPANQLLTVPLTTDFVTIQPGQSITIMFDVLAYAPPLSTVNFSSTLAPSPTLPFFTDPSGNAVTQMVAVGPSVAPSVAPASIALTPASASYPAGTNATITATVTDANHNPVPNTLVFFAFNSGPDSGPTGPLATDANGNAVFTYTNNGGAGTDMVQASVASLTATPVSVTWTAPGPLDHITISPATASIASGGSQSYTAAAFDRFNNSIGDVTSQTSFAITPDGSCTLANCTATVAGPHTVIATYNGKTAAASLTVNAGGKTNPVITWPTPAAITFGTPLCSTQLDATANVPGKFVYSPQAGAILHAGSQTLSVTFTPTDTSQYNTVTATVTLQVKQAKPPVLWVPLPVVSGQPLGPLQLDALTIVPGGFAYNPPAGTVLSLGKHTLSAVFTPKDTTDFQTITVQAVVEVVKPKH